jgi:hypothetical protein
MARPYRRSIPVNWDNRPPDNEPAHLSVALVDDWAQTIQVDKPTALGTPLRNSDAGKCSRAMAYSVAKVPRSNPPDLASFWRMGVGQFFHDMWQDRLTGIAGVESETQVATPGCEGSGHIDATEPAVAHELKTVNRLKFEHSIGWVNNRPAPAKGPEWAHVAQGALNAAGVQALNPDGPDVLLVVTYFSLESLSPSSGNRIFGKGHDPKRRFMATWTFVREEWEPIAVAEAERMQYVLDTVRESGPEAVGRYVPTVGSIAPGDHWLCKGYCDYESICRADWALRGAA